MKIPIYGGYVTEPSAHSEDQRDQHNACFSGEKEPSATLLYYKKSTCTIRSETLIFNVFDFHLSPRL